MIPLSCLRCSLWIRLLAPTPIGYVARYTLLMVYALTIGHRLLVCNRVVMLVRLDVLVLVTVCRTLTCRCGAAARRRSG